MVPTHATKNKNKRYRYYVCSNAQKRGWHNCPAPSVPAPEVERFIVEQIKCIGRDPELMTETLNACRKHEASRIDELASEKRSLARELRRSGNELKKTATSKAGVPYATDRLADLQDRIGVSENRMVEVDQQLTLLRGEQVSAAELETACKSFDPLWETLTTREQGRILQLLIERVEYDSNASELAITFHQTGIKSLGQQA